MKKPEKKLTQTDSSADRKVKLLSSNEKSFRVITGSYKVLFRPELNHMVIKKKKGKKNLVLNPGGKNPDLPILIAENIQDITTKSEETLRVNISGMVKWTNFTLKLLFPKSEPGLINCRLELETTRDVEPKDRIFANTQPELSYENAEKILSSDNPIYYFNGPTNAENWDLRKDLNQFIFFGDRRGLESTLLYFLDMTSLNSFFELSNTAPTKVVEYTKHIDDIVKQPPGAYGSERDFPFSFGYEIPNINSKLKKDSKFLVSNSFIALSPSAPEKGNPIEYSKRFIKSIAMIYPHLMKPETEYINWPAIVEKEAKDLLKYRKKYGKSEHKSSFNPLKDVYVQRALHRYAINSFRRYSKVFQSKTVNRLLDVEDAEDRVGNASSLEKPARVDAWEGFFWPVLQMGEHAHLFGGESTKDWFLGTEDVIRELGRKMDYVFPVFIDVKNMKRLDSNGIWNYDCASACLYIMLLYYEFTRREELLEEATYIAEKILSFGFSNGYEMNVTAIGSLGLLKLYRLTGKRKFLEGSYVTLANILKDSWFFNLEYGRYEDRKIFLLNSARANLSYANGLEEAALIRYLYRYLEEGEELMSEAIQLTSELLKYKCTSLKDSLAPLLPNRSLVYEGRSREGGERIPNKNWHVPLEPFGVCRDKAKLGHINQATYCAGVLPEAALLQFHLLSRGVLLYVESPIKLKREDEKFFFKSFAKTGTFRACLIGEDEKTSKYSIFSREWKDKIKTEKNSELGVLEFSIKADREYIIK